MQVSSSSSDSEPETKPVRRYTRSCSKASLVSASGACLHDQICHSFVTELQLKYATLRSVLYSGSMTMLVSGGFTGMSSRLLQGLGTGYTSVRSVSYFPCKAKIGLDSVQTQRGSRSIASRVVIHASPGLCMQCGQSSTLGNPPLGLRRVQLSGALACMPTAAKHMIIGS